MNRLVLVVLLLAGPAFADPTPASIHAADNEAIHSDASGKRTVQLPPAPVGVNGHAQAPRAMTTPIGDTLHVYMVETSAGLQECTKVDFKDGECRTSTIGQKTIDRTWVVRRQGRWWLCAGIDSKADCLDPPAFNGGKGDAAFHLPSSKM